MSNDEQAPLLPITVSQTVGPFFHIGLDWLFSDRVVDEGVPGRHIIIRGSVVDGDGEPVPDAVLEIWQADPNGRYAPGDEVRGHNPIPGFRGYARVPTSDDGTFRFLTVKPGPVPAPDGGSQAPHVLVAIFMRGILRQLVTRIYFADEEASNAVDLVLQRVPASRRSTLIAKPVPAQAGVFEWKVFLQGPNETVFFDC